MTNSIHRGRVFVAGCAGMALFGIALAMPGTILGFPAMRERMHVDIQQQGFVSSLLIVGVWIATLFAGPVIDRFGNKIVLVLSGAFTTAGLAAFAWATSFPLLAGAAIVLGLGGGGFNTASNAVVSSVYEEKRAAMLNLIGVFFGGGAFSLVAVAGNVSPAAAIRSAFVFSALWVVGYALLQFPPAKEAHSFSLSAAAKIVTYPGVLLFAVALFFESANEQTMNTFTLTWLNAAGAAKAALGYAGYHLGMSIGRLLAVPVLARFDKRKVILGSAIGAVCGTTSLFVSHAPLVMGISIVVTALSFAAIYPTVLGIAGDRYQRFAGTVFGTLFAISLLGAVAAPSVVGLIARNSGVLNGTVVPLVISLFVLVLAAVATRQAKAQHEPARTVAAIGED